MAERIRGGKLSGFWQRISEGRRLDELWSQFSADARASYGFYTKEADAEELTNRRGRPALADLQNIVLVAGDEADARGAYW
jgi:hypothetical protein